MSSVQTSSSITSASKANDIAAATVVDEAAMENAGVQSGIESQGRSVQLSSVLIDRFLNLISSVPFGIVLLVLIIIASMIGMLIQQQELETFGGYYAELTPAEKIVYGNLGFFDIYRTWYFNLMLLLLSLNIILASIDHFPAAWSHVTRKKLTASSTFAMAQKFKERVELPLLDRKQLTDRVTAAARAMKFKVRVTEEESRTTVFAERGVWNRLGAYGVHIGLLMILISGFWNNRYGYTGGMWIEPEKIADSMKQQAFNIDKATNEYAIGEQDLKLPFTIEGIDIQQKLLDNSKSIDTGNTLDWLTRIRIYDHETGQKTDALVHMNKPFDYRGYRFFQASFNQFGNARVIKVRVTPASGGPPEEIEIKRNGSAKLSDGTQLRYDQFNPAFTITAEQGVGVSSRDYVNPAANLTYLKPDGEQGNIWAFNKNFIDEISGAPFLRSKFLETGPYQFMLVDFEKAPHAHMLSIQYYPGSTLFYIGSFWLCLMLVAVFFFSHQRLWIVVEDGNVYLGGNSNRNRLGFEDRAKNLIARIRWPQSTT
jgi:cytochrome c biogenesis protein